MNLNISIHTLLLLLCTLTAPPVTLAQPVDAPRPVAPTNNSTTLHEHPHLSWTQIYTPRAEAMPEYTVQIARDTGFKELVDSDTIAAVITRYVPAKALAPGLYHWRVRGRDADQKPSPWSAYASFRIKPPEKVFTVPLG
ncbi:MAG: glycoside hydrolase family 78 protein, partial [Planctomycetota bacterium]